MILWHTLFAKLEVYLMGNTPVKGWNHLPNVPIKVSPFFQWPLRPKDMLVWMWNSWFLISEKLIIVGIAFVSFYLFQPSLEETKNLEASWIFQMYFRNLVLMSTVAGGLHLYFYTFSRQGKKLRYDPRPL